MAIAPNGYFSRKKSNKKKENETRQEEDQKYLATHRSNTHESNTILKVTLRWKSRTLVIWLGFYYKFFDKSAKIYGFYGIIVLSYNKTAKVQTFDAEN